MGPTSTGRSSRASFTTVIGLAAIASAAAACGSSSSAGAGDAGATTYAASASTPGCDATVSQGSLAGKAAGSTCEYLGIPYAQPPVGDLRFMPPQPAGSWTGTRAATAFGASCEQASSILGAVGTTSEDCLFVNVYTPKAAPAQPLPVMVFIYGGAFTSGSSSTYDGEALSEKGPVVLVTLNYRLGALGFLALPELDAQRPGAPSGSDGIRDQQLALQWVHDNISTFHGDPSNVTVFGESAGSMSTCIHVVSPGSQGLAERYIMESGSCVGKSSLLDTQAQSYQIGEALAASLCSDAGAPDAGADLSCLRAKDAQALMTWEPPAGTATTGVDALLGDLLGPPFAPTIEGTTGGVLPDTPDNLIAQGKFDQGATFLAGTNENEWGLFVDLATNPLFGGSTSSRLNVTTCAQLDQGITQVFGAAIAPGVEAQYPCTDDATASQTYVDLVTDYAFRCPTRDLARALEAKGVSTYRLYSYEIGKAWHSFELVPLFDVTALQLLGATKPSAAYTQDMLGYWTQFAATGDPNAPGGTAPQWPAYTEAGEQYMQLVDPTPAAMADLRTAQCDYWDSL